MIPHQKPQASFTQEKQSFTQQQNLEHITHQNMHMHGGHKPAMAVHAEMKSPEKAGYQGGLHGSQQGGLAFSNPFGVQSQQSFGMTRSYMKPQGEDLGTFKKEMLIKFHEVNRLLSQHGQQIQQLKQHNLTNSTMSSMSSTFDFKADSVNSDMIRNLRKDFDFDQQSLSNRIMHEIESLRTEINERFTRKTEFDMNLSRFEAKLIDTFPLRKDIMKDINDLRDRNSQECRNIYQFFKKEIEANIHHIHQANRLVFNKIEKDMIEIRQFIENQKTEIARLKINTDNQIKIFTSSKKFYDPRIVKYREFIQKATDKSYEKPGDQIMINQVIYYLDRDGYLLDSHSNYLVDQNNQQVLLEQKHLNLLKFYNLLQ